MTGHLIDCPVCLAASGEPCVASDGSTRSPHFGRRAASAEPLAAMCVQCPWCFAFPFEACVSSNDAAARPAPHQARVMEAERAQWFIMTQLQIDDIMGTLPFSDGPHS